MDINNSTDLQNQLKAAYSELEGRKPQAAIDRLMKIKLGWPNNSDAEHLIALSYKSMGDLMLSKRHFIRCLEINQEQPEVHNNLANLLKSQGALVDAEQHYLKALALHPNYLQAQRNLAICYQAQENYTDAISAYGVVLNKSPNDVSSINGKADCFRLKGDFLTAHNAYKEALAIDPNRLKSWHNLGLNFHLQGQLNEAINCYRKAYDIAPNTPEVTESFALSLYENGDVTMAVELFKGALNAYPDNVQLHERLNSMLWETELVEQFGDSSVEALKQRPDNNELALSYASMLYLAGRVRQAESIIKAAGLDASNHFDVLSLRGQIEEELGDYDSAYETLSFSLRHQFSQDVARQMVKIDIILKRYSQAQRLLTAMFADVPNCQLTWALQSLVWRLCDDERYHWLCDYPKFIKVYQLDVPKGYAALNDFLLAVRDELTPLHQNESEPLQQTLRNGTQTAARLLHTPTPVFKALKESISALVRRYIDDLPNDMSHPFLARKSSQFEFSGSWSVKLRADGFHINHVHPEGWISSSCYISIPKSMGESDALDGVYQGHIKFGESPLQLGDRELIEFALEPKPGMVVLFPSYFWHGTYPFKGGESDYRLTAPFDVLPR